YVSTLYKSVGWKIPNCDPLGQSGIQIGLNFNAVYCWLPTVSLCRRCILLATKAMARK
ncbi:1031_t:CDS:1, partial [Gigaspora rosea]